MAVKYALMDGSSLDFPDKPGENASIEEKIAYWREVDKLYNVAAQRDQEYVNGLQKKLNGLKGKEDTAEWSNLANQLVDAESKLERAIKKANNVSVSAPNVSTTKSGENVQTTNTYRYTDEMGNDYSVSDTSDNAGKTQSQLYSEEQERLQREQNARDTLAQAQSNISNTQTQAAAARDTTLLSAQLTRDAELAQYQRNLDLVSGDFESDKLEGNQDLLRASNTIGSNAVKNSREAATLLGQYSLAGSSLAPRLTNIAANAANEASNTAALTYNAKMNEATRNFNTAGLELENYKADTLNKYGQREAQAKQDYFATIGGAYGKAAEAMSPYDQDQSNAFAEQARQAATDQGDVRASNYVSDYQAVPNRLFNAGLSVYRPVNSSTKVFGLTQPKLEVKK
jgi:hypothetical protein